MAIFQDLPIELLIKIIELSVEDAIAVNNEKLRRQILLRLSLVSKDFTLPSQVALWRNIRLYNDDSTQRLLVNAIAEDKIVEQLELFLHYKPFDKLDLSNLKIFLNRLKRVDSLLLCIDTMTNRLVKLDDLLETSSLKELKSLSINWHISFNIGRNLQLPYLQHLTIYECTPQNDEFFSKIIEASSNTLTSLQLEERTKFDSYSSSKTLDSIKRHTPRLITLRVTDCGDQLPLDLFPLCVSLKSLELDCFNNSFNTNVLALNFLPTSSRVESLTIDISSLVYPRRNNLGRSLVGNEDFNAFITTLDLAQFRELKYLYLHLRYNTDNQIGKAAVKCVKERVDFIEKLEKRGIKLKFGKETHSKIREEKEKQRLYQERQMKLDKDLKC